MKSSPFLYTLIVAGTVRTCHCLRVVNVFYANATRVSTFLTLPSLRSQPMPR